MAKAKQAFYAYPGQPPAVGEVIESAARELTKSRRVKIKTWRQLAVPGKLIIKQVLDAINAANVFACDLTYPNPNVLFELGYAIGKRKGIWVSLDTTIAEARDTFNQLQATLCPVIGYASYTNSKELVQQYTSTPPWVDVADSLLGAGFSPKARKPPHPALLYLKQPHDTQASVTLTDLLSGSVFASGLLTDNPKDNPSPTLNWYAEKIRDSDVTVVHFLSEHHNDHVFHNLKCAFVGGLARGLERPVLMLAAHPYSTPVDYRDLLYVHSTAEDCEKYTIQWLSNLVAKIPGRRESRTEDESEASPDLALRHLSVGEYVAEYEHHVLGEYYVDTSWFRDAIRNQHTIFVGRRGTGKTASSYAIEREVKRRRDNHVCKVQPVAYEVDGLVRLLSQNIDKSERGYLIESLWKFLIYTELANSVVLEYESRPLHELANVKSEMELVEFVRAKSDLILQPFSVRNYLTLHHGKQ